MSEYIKADAVMDVLDKYFGNYANIPLQLEDMVEDIPGEPVVACSVLLDEADRQDHIGFIQTAKVLRRVADDNE